jgi:predicted dienelactone hydrolase
MHQITHRAIALLLPSLICANALGQELVTLTRSDRATLQVEVYSPSGNSCKGTVIFSPGAGGSETGYGYLGEGLSQAGWLTAVVGHKESSRKAVREQAKGQGIKAGLNNLITDPAAYKARFIDIDAARQWVAGRCSSPFLAMAGHSMGAATTMMEAGAKNNLGVSAGSAPFQAYVALSPQGVGPIFPANAWQGLTMPVLTITGTKDDEIDGNDYRVRLQPYENMPSGCKWSGVIQGANHLNFAGIGFSGRTKNLTVETMLAFLQGVQSGNCKPPDRAGGIEIQSK